MVLYFSATGNCKYVATRLVQSARQEMLSIVDCIQSNRYNFTDDAIGIVSPTYFWTLPNIVKEFLEKATFETEYLYFISTYGTTTGASGDMASKSIHGRKIDAFYSVRMADTWTPVFDLSSPKKIAVFTRTTESEIDEIISGVSEKRTIKHMAPRTPAFITELVSQPIYDRIRRNPKFHVEDSCIGCGLCERRCPVSAIKMENGRPSWQDNRCVMCFGCLHRCPKFAIQYGKNTKHHGQYTNPNVKL